MDALPKYWGLLSEADQVQYNALRIAFTPGSILSPRNASPETFEDMLSMIRNFAERGDDNDWRRFLVCGICWLDDAVAVNTRQLRLLVSKCKSSINGSLQKMGFTTNTSHTESWKNLFPKIPLLKDNFHELRQWTIRYRMSPEQKEKQKNNKNIERTTYEIPKIQNNKPPFPPLPTVKINPMPFPDIHLPKGSERIGNNVVTPIKFRNFIVGNDK